MALGTTTVSVLGDLLKRVYTPGIQNQLNEKTFLRNMFPKTSDVALGSNFQFYFALKSARNHGIKWIPEGGQLPTAASMTHKQGTASIAYLYGALEFTAQAMKAMKTSEATFLDGLNEAVVDLATTMQLEQERMLLGDGSGVLCQINEPGYTMLTTVPAGTAINVDEPGARVLERGMIVALYSAKSGGTLVSPFDNTNLLDYAIIDEVDYVNNQIKFAVDVNVQDNYYLFRHGSYNIGMLGIKGILDHSLVGTLHGINRTSGNDEWFRSNIRNAGGARLSLLGIEEWLEDAFRNGGGEIDFFLTSYEQRRLYASLFLGDRRYAPTDKLVNGMTFTSFLSGDKEIPILVHRFWDADKFVGLDKKVFQFVDLGLDWVIADEDQGDVLKLKSGYHIYQAYLYDWCQLICKAPNHNIYVYGLATS